MAVSLNEEKLFLGILCVLVISGVALATGRWPQIQAIYTSFVGGITCVYAVFCGANVARSFVDNKYGGNDDTSINPPQNKS
jgi:hypothetical protein